MSLISGPKMHEGLPYDMNGKDDVMPSLEITDSNDKASIIEDFNCKLLEQSSLSEAAELFVKAVPKNKFQTDLRTIRESPETVYTVRYIVDMEDNDEGIPIPEAEPAVPNVVIVEIEDEDGKNEDDSKDVEKSGDVPQEKSSGDGVQDLKVLNERADRLSKELKQLNIETNQDMVDAEEQSVEFKEIMRQYSDFIIIIESDEKGNEVLVDGPLPSSEDQLDQVTEKDALKAEGSVDEVIDTLSEAAKVENKIEEEAISEDITKEKTDPSDLSKSDDVVATNAEAKESINTPTSNVAEAKKSDISIPSKEHIDEDSKTNISEEQIVSETNNDTEIKSPITESVKDCEKINKKAEAIEDSLKVQDEASIQSPDVKNAEDINESLKDTASDSIDAVDEITDDVKEPDDAKTNSNDIEEIDELTAEEALEKLRRLKSKRSEGRILPMFPDLSIEGEKLSRARSNGSYHYWQFPFRHQLFEQMMREDP